MVIGVCLSLASCSTSPGAIETSPVLAPSSPLESSTESAPPSSSEAGPQDFRKVLTQSCERALAVGIEESTAEASFAYYLFPEELSVDGYSAIAHDIESDEVSLVWETDAFYVCYFANQISLAEEFDAPVSFSFVATRSGFELVDTTIGETYTYIITLSDGLVSRVDDGTSDWVIKYGIEETKVSLLKRAVKEFAD